MTPHEFWIWSLTGWMECRGEPLEGQRAVMHAIWNRFKSGKWYGGKTITLVCWRDQQFSCWNASTSDNNRELAAVLPDDDPVLAGFAKIAADIASGTDPSPVGEATHYVNPDAVQTMPAWATPERFVIKIGRHEFFRNVP